MGYVRLIHLLYATEATEVFRLFPTCRELYHKTLNVLILLKISTQEQIIFKKYMCSSAVCIKHLLRIKVASWNLLRNDLYLDMPLTTEDQLR